MTAAGSDRPIIVLGCPRSGTTMVQVMLHSHPRIAIPPENRFVLPAYQARRRFGDLRDPARRRALGRFIARRKGRKFRDLGLKRRETVEKIVAGPPTLGSALGIVLEAYADRFDKPRWGDKRPAYHNFIGFLLRLFPDAHLVHLVRDPRDCIASLKRMPWWGVGTHQSVAAWAASIEHTDEAIRRLPGSVTRVQYERLVADPERELQALCAALGEEYDPAMAAPQLTAPTAVPRRKHWHENTRLAPTAKNVGRWRTQLEPWELALCETVLREPMERFGYERSGAGRPGPEHLLRYAQARTSRKITRRKLLLKDRWNRRHEANPVAALLTSGQRRAAGL